MKQPTRCTRTTQVTTLGLARRPTLLLRVVLDQELHHLLVANVARDLERRAEGIVASAPQIWGRPQPRAAGGHREVAGPRREVERPGIVRRRAGIGLRAAVQDELDHFF